MRLQVLWFQVWPPHQFLQVGNFMKKIFILNFRIVVTLFFALLMLANPVLAQTSDKYGLTATAKKAELTDAVAGATDVPSLVGLVVNSVLGIMGIIFFGLIFYSGLRWMTAKGNSDSIEKSKETILSAAIGLVIILAAYAITNFIFDNLTTVAV